jgi:hypothetical protein
METVALSFVIPSSRLAESESGEKRQSLYPLQHRRVKSKGAPGLAFETWDPSNQFPLETPTLLFVIRSEAQDSALSFPPGRVPHVCVGAAGALHGLNRMGRSPFRCSLFTCSETKETRSSLPGDANDVKPTCPGVPWRDLRFRGPLLETRNTTTQTKCHLTGAYRISCHAALDTAACAPFFKERRMSWVEIRRMKSPAGTTGNFQQPLKPDLYGCIWVQADHRDQHQRWRRDRRFLSVPFGWWALSAYRCREFRRVGEFRDEPCLSFQPSGTPALRKTASELSRPAFAAASGVMSFVRPKTSTLSAS